MHTDYYIKYCSAQTLAEIDRRMLDFVVGLDTEFSELMDGSHLYTPTVAIEEAFPPTCPPAS